MPEATNPPERRTRSGLITTTFSPYTKDRQGIAYLVQHSEFVFLCDLDPLTDLFGCVLASDYTSEEETPEATTAIQVKLSCWPCLIIVALLQIAAGSASLTSLMRGNYSEPSHILAGVRDECEEQGKCSGK